MDCTSGAISYDVYFGAGSLPGVLTANVTTNNYPTGTLLPNTTYYWKIVPKSICGITTGTPVIWSFTTSALPCYCPSSGSSPVSNGITGVTFNTINNLNNGTVVGYSNFTPINTTVLKGSSYNLTVRVNTGVSNTSVQTAWFDWDGNGVFSAAKQFNVGTATNTSDGVSSLTPSITVPAGAITGTVRMRIQSRRSASDSSCATGFFGEVEDYLINIIVPVPCSTPTMQPTALSLSATGTFISGSFTAAVPAPNGYLVVYNTTGTPPSPFNGTVYTVGSTVGVGNIVASIDNGTTFNITGLMNTKTYYIYIFSYNSFCTGGPLYNTTSPLNDFITTDTSGYCTPSVSPGQQTVNYIKQVNFVGTLNDVSNSSTFSSNPIGFEDYSSLPKATQAQGQGVNVYVETPSLAFYKAWVDWNKNGVFTDAGEQVYTSTATVPPTTIFSTTFGFIIPLTQPIGDYRLRIRITNSSAGSGYGSCINLNAGGETEDYLFTVVAGCAASITSVTDGEVCGPGPVAVTISATGSIGVTGYNWYTTQTGGTPVNATPTAITWNTPLINSTTTYYVVAVNGCESVIRTPVVAKVKAVSNVTFTPASPEVCGEDVIIAVSATGDNEEIELIDEKFNTGLGVFANERYVDNGATINGKTAWQNRTSTYVPDEEVWFPAISSGSNLNGFVMSNSDVGNYVGNNGLVSPVVNSSTLLDLTLTFDIFYSKYSPDFTNLASDYVTVDVSVNGGTTWTEIDRYLSDQGIGTRFVPKTYNLNSYINIPTLKIRINYYGVFSDGVAIDNIRLFGNKKLTTSFTWSNPVPIVPLTGFAFINNTVTTPYLTGSTISTVYIKPTATQLIGTTFSFDATVKLSNGCDVTKTIEVANKSKTWVGATTDWNTASNWQPAGVPDITNCVIIPNIAMLNTGVPGFAKNLVVKNGGTFEIQGENSLTVKEEIKIEPTGTFNIKNNSSLVQIDNVVNTGNINMERIANVKRFDYVYWSSPVKTFASSAISPGTTAGFIYKWIPTIPTNINGWGNWTFGSETMLLGKGYIVRAPNASPVPSTPFIANFIGVPNNGDITIPIERGIYNGADYSTGVSTTLATKDDDNWNLLGNPYPSAINPTSFLLGNTNLEGFVKVWSHGTPLSTLLTDPFYNDYVYNYTPGDYITYNGSGSTVGPGVNNIAAGQGFITLMDHTSASASENVTFTNAMRRDGSGNVYSNNQFYRTGNRDNLTVNEQNRMWIDLISPDNKNIRTLLGYIEGATNEEDRLFDAFTDNKLSLNLYSIINEKPMTIQGRALPFDDSDIVSIGYNAPIEGNYTMALATVDGLFSGSQEIYIEDKELSIIHNLKQNPYYFSTQPGIFKNRFVIRYTPQENKLYNKDFDENNEVSIFVKDYINIKTTNQSIKAVSVYDVSGKTLYERKQIDKKEIVLQEIQSSNGIVLVKLLLENGVEVTRKIHF